MTRFNMLLAVAALLIVSQTAFGQKSDFRIERSMVVTGTDDFRYQQVRAAYLPGPKPKCLITLQETDRVGTHAYRDMYQMTSDDHGKTWTQPTAIESLRRTTRADGADFFIGDVTPQWHAKTKTVLATGKTFQFDGGVKENRSGERVSYSVYDPAKDSWNGLHIMEMPKKDGKGASILQPNAGCTQRIDLPDGRILLPVRYLRTKKNRRYVSTVALCRYDGKTLQYEKQGSELTIDRGRGLYEPSLAKCGDYFYLTLRADDTGYVARSRDGLEYEPMREWTFDDGQPLGSYNTQQHWIVRGEKLYLVYTRRGAKNDHIFRHRAPLFIAQVDPERMCVIRKTEQTAIPEEGAAHGNSGVCQVGDNEAWIVSAEELRGASPRFKEKNRVFVARIIWD